MSRNEERWGDQVGHPYLDYRFYLCDRGKIVPRPRAEVAHARGIWNFDTEGNVLYVYVTCPVCGWANNIIRHTIYNQTGRVRDECVICSNRMRCGIHFFPQLVGWRPSFARKLGQIIRPTKRRVDVR